MKQKLIAMGLKFTMVHNPLTFTSALDSKAHHFELAVCSFNWMVLSNGSLGKHPSLHSDSKMKVLPLIVFAQTFEDREFQQAKDWGIDDYLDAPFFDEDVSDVIMEAQMQAKGLRYTMGINDESQSVALGDDADDHQNDVSVRNWMGAPGGAGERGGGGGGGGGGNGNGNGNGNSSGGGEGAGGSTGGNEAPASSAEVVLEMNEAGAYAGASRADRRWGCSSDCLHTVYPVHTLNLVYPYSLKAPWFQPLEPIKSENPVSQSLLFFKCVQFLCRYASVSAADVYGRRDARQFTAW